jgi:hypothetical protein
MELSKQQIKAIKKAWVKAEKAEQMSQIAQGALARLIIEITGVDGYVDVLTGDGMGFTPKSNNDTHIYIGDLIKLAESGIEITEDVILDNLTL